MAKRKPKFKIEQDRNPFEGMRLFGVPGVKDGTQIGRLPPLPGSYTITFDEPMPPGAELILTLSAKPKRKAKPEP